MILSYDKFRQIFDNYCEKATKHQAAWIPKDSWRVIKDFLGQYSGLKEDVCITFIDVSEKDTSLMWKTTISPIYCSPAQVVYIPSALKHAIEEEGETQLLNKIGVSTTSSSCFNVCRYDPILDTTIATDSLTRQILSNISLTDDHTQEGTLVFNPETGTMSYVYNGQLKPVTSGASYYNYAETKEKENDTMNIPTMKFDFGPANPEAVSMSPYGLAVRCGDSWYAYNASEGQTIDVTGLTFSFKNAIYKMPVAVNQVKEGDLIIHQKKAMYVVQINDKTSIEVIDLAASEQKTVIPVSNMFGFSYVTKVAPLFNLGSVTPSAENPFGNILPMMMMSSMFEDDKNNKSEGNDFMQMMLMMSLMNGTNPFSALFAGAGPQAE